MVVILIQAPPLQALLSGVRKPLHEHARHDAQKEKPGNTEAESNRHGIAAIVVNGTWASGTGGCDSSRDGGRHGS